MKTTVEELWHTDSNSVRKENKAMTQRNMKKSQFCTQRRPKDLSSNKILEKYKDLEAFYKKTVLKNLAVIHRKTTVLQFVF